MSMRSRFGGGFRDKQQQNQGIFSKPKHCRPVEVCDGQHQKHRKKRALSVYVCMEYSIGDTREASPFGKLGEIAVYSLRGSAMPSLCMQQWSELHLRNGGEQKMRPNCCLQILTLEWSAILFERWPEADPQIRFAHCRLGHFCEGHETDQLNLSLWLNTREHQQR